MERMFFRVQIYFSQNQANEKKICVLKKTVFFGAHNFSLKQICAVYFLLKTMRSNKNTVFLVRAFFHSHVYF